MPSFVTLPFGLRLFHGTDALNRFVFPTGPAWFSQSEEVATYFSQWHGQGNEGRILRYEVVRPIKVVEFHTAQDISDLADELGRDFTSEPDSFCDAGFAGWDVVGNYAPEVSGQQAGDDIMLCNPEKWLRRLR